MKTNKTRYSAVFAMIKQINQFDKEYTYKDAVMDFTNGKTSSLSSISDTQLPYFAEMLRSKVGAGKAQYASDPRDKQRKAIIAIFKRKGKTVQDAIAWAEKRGVKGEKRNFNDYNGQELYNLTIAAENIKK